MNPSANHLAPDMAVLLVASAGGHLVELIQIAEMLEIRNRHWVTYDNPMARSVLAGEPVSWARHAPPRDPTAVLHDVPLAMRVMQRESVNLAVTTGASIAVGWLAAARLRGVDCHFIESAARSHGPSLSMRICSVIPGVNLYTQSESWADDRHIFFGSVFDGFGPGTRRALPQRRLRVLVTLGTNKDFGFRRLVDRVCSITEDCEVRWQISEQDTDHAPANARTRVPWVELWADHEWADVVVAHAGVGSALTAFRSGRHPILVPRSPELGENMDGHQRDIEPTLRGRDIATVCDVDMLTIAELREAATRSVVRTVVSDRCLSRAGYYPR
jgi:UDP-N-acetylglucosamine transferase subunit ALG13